MNLILRILLILLLFCEFKGNLGSNLIPKDLFESIELIAGSKYQYVTLKKVQKTLAKHVIQHHITDLNTVTSEKLVNRTEENAVVFYGDLRQIKNLEQFQIPHRIMIAELKSMEDEM